MPTTHLDPSRLRATGGVSPDRPVTMLNLVRFREQAEYGPASGYAPCSGRTAYLERYVPAFRAIAPAFGGTTPVYVGEAHELLVGPDDEHWDLVALIRYPDLPTLRAFLDDERYLREAAPHRIAALADWRFQVTSAP
ncbi:MULTISPECIES: DUF1330 domain-containing protein [Actinomycetospora]|uniref:DUF1330 domain-containing protein n=1 Tax=Actinomycetospora TaxID=402649 RepID=UPI001E3525A7|nr:DUF1330 domain-containing protein [Actinomycetospora soli]MCD2189575.1 DUF1330 domain-containing protein [Actinomycetospora soli]